MQQGDTIQLVLNDSFIFIYCCEIYPHYVHIFNSKKKIAFRDPIKYFESAPPELGWSGDNKQFFKFSLQSFTKYLRLTLVFM